jgi:hypothetical protein
MIILEEQGIKATTTSKTDMPFISDTDNVVDFHLNTDESLSTTDAEKHKGSGDTFGVNTSIPKKKGTGGNKTHHVVKPAFTTSRLGKASSNTPTPVKKDALSTSPKVKADAAKSSLIGKHSVGGHPASKIEEEKDEEVIKKAGKLKDGDEEEIEDADEEGDDEEDVDNDDEEAEAEDEGEADKKK